MYKVCKTNVDNTQMMQNKCKKANNINIFYKSKLRKK